MAVTTTDGVEPEACCPRAKRNEPRGTVATTMAIVISLPFTGQLSCGGHRHMLICGRAADTRIIVTKEL